MTDHRPFAAPGCYGVGAIYNEEAKECKSCPFREQCHPVAKAALARLRAKYAIKAIERPAPKIVTTAAGPTGRPALPKKVQELMVKIEQAGIRVKDSLRSGKNPFGKHDPKHLYITAFLMLRCPGGFHIAELEKQFGKAFGWKEGTAAAHRAQAVQFFKAYGVADDTGGILKLKATA